MPPWLSQISAAQKKESNQYSSRWVQIATIGIDNIPRVRTVVFRGWSDSYEMEIYTDKRSQKYKELKMNNRVEVCWLFTKAKCQFRLRGTTFIELGKDKLRHWDRLSENTKSMLSWPTPDDHFIEKKNDLSVKTPEKQLNNFTLLKIDIPHVDQLILNKPIHTRRRWIRENNWIEELINP